MEGDVDIKGLPHGIVWWEEVDWGEHGVLCESSEWVAG